MLEKNCFFLILLFVLSYLFPSTGLSQVNNKAQWDAAFDEMYGDAEPMLDITNANEDGGLAWEASYWLRAYISMAQTFGDSKYLDRAVRLIEFLLANRDDARLARGELNLQKQPYHTAPLPYLNNRQQAAPGWRHWDSHYKGWRVLLIDDAMITGAIMRFVALVYERDSFTGYRPKADDYIAKVEETVRAHDDSFVFNRFENIPGNYYYPAPDGSGLHTGAVEFNMSAAMGTTLLLLDKVRGGVEGNQRKALAILDYFKHHAHIDLGFFVLAHRRGLAFSKADMQRFAATLTKNVYRGNGELSWSVDGKETNVEKNYWPAGFDWIDLAAFDAKVLAIAREVYTKHYPTPTWARSFLGWAEILRWTKILAENDFTSPLPPENLRLFLEGYK